MLWSVFDQNSTNWINYDGRVSQILYGQRTHNAKIVLIVQICPKIYQPNFSAKLKSLGFLKKKSSLCVFIVRDFISVKNARTFQIFLPHMHRKRKSKCFENQSFSVKTPHDTERRHSICSYIFVI